MFFDADSKATPSSLKS